jgi:hypothetical protein
MIKVIKNKSLKDRTQYLVEVPDHLDGQFIKNALDNSHSKLKGTKTKINIRDVIFNTRVLFGLKYSEFLHKKEDKKATLCRQIVVYICRENGYKYNEIQQYMTPFTITTLGGLYANCKRKLISNMKTISPYVDYINKYT